MKIKLALAIPVLIAATSFHRPHGDAASTVSTKRALLIGIDQYSGLDAFSQLHGCVNDINLMQDLLIKRGFSKDNIKQVKNENATKKDIFAAFDTLIKSITDSSDIVVIQMSSHGSQVLDLTDRELDGLSETLIPHDYINTDRDARRTSIIDTQMDSLLTLLTAKTKRVTVILDACHSYGATRNLTGLHPRFVPSRLTHQDSLKMWKMRRARTANPSAYKKNPPTYTLIAGCASDELANEYRAPGGTPYGAMTWFLANELQKTGGPQTWPDIVHNVKADVQGLYPGQTPELGGANADAFVFGDITYVNHQFYYTSPRPDGLVDVQGGSAYGFDTGSVFRVYPPGTNDFKNTNPIARIQITEVGAFTSKARILRGSIAAANSKAQEDQHNYINVPLKLVFGGNWANLADLKTAVTSLPAITEDANDPDLLLQAGLDGIRITLAKDTSRLLNYLQMADAKDSGLVKTIQNWQHWFHVLMIQNPDNKIKFIDTMRLIAHTRSRGGITEQLYRPDYVFNDGDSVELTITNSTPGTLLYFHVLDLQDDGIISAGTFADLGNDDQWRSNDFIAPGVSRSERFVVWIRDGRTSSLDVMKIYATNNKAVDFSHLATNSPDTLHTADEHLMSRELFRHTMKLDNWATLTNIILTK